MHKCDCPYCPGHEDINDSPWTMPKMPPPPGLGCVLNQPLGLVIPPEGMDLHCPIHGTHRVYGPQVTC